MAAFSQAVWPYRGVLSYGKCSSPEFNRGDNRGVRHFPCICCEMSMCISTAQARDKMASTCPCACPLRAQVHTKPDISYRNLAKKELVKRACQELAKSLSSDLAKGPLMEISFTDLATCQEASYLKRSFQQSSYRDLVQDLAQETPHGDLVRRPGEESMGLTRRSFIDSWNKGLTTSRSLTKIFCGDLFKADLFKSLAKRPVTVMEVLYRDLARTPLFQSLRRDIAKRSNAEILPRGPVRRSCQETSSKDLVEKSFQDTSYGDLLPRNCIESL